MSTTECETEIEAGPSAEMSEAWIDEDVQQTPLIEVIPQGSVPAPQRKPPDEFCEC